MSSKIAARMDRMVPSGIRKINEKALAMERQGEKVLHFEIGRPDFDTPEYIKKAAYKAIEEGKVHYTSNFGTMELRQAIADKLLRENHVAYKPTEVLVAAGLSEAVLSVLVTILDPDDEILIPDPVWLNYLNVPYLLGAKPVQYELKEENNYQLNIEEIKSKITGKTKAIVIVTPNNPTGGVLTRPVLEELAQIAISHDLLVIADEVYERLIYDGSEHISIASLPGMKERTFTLNGMSKAYAMDGWRLGYVAAPEEFILKMNVFHQHNVTCASSIAQAAGLAALTQEGDEVEEMVREYQRRRDYAVKAINEIDGVSCLCPGGAFYIFINVKKLGMPSSQVCEYLLEHAKVAMVPGNIFGQGGEGYIRMSFASSYENIVEGCARLGKAVAELMKK